MKCSTLLSRMAGLLIVSIALPGCAQKPEPGTTWNLSTLSSIGNQPPDLLGSPQVVPSPDGFAIKFNGQSDGVLLPINPIKGFKEFTIQVLIKPESGGNLEQRFLHVQDELNSRGLLELRMYDNGWALDAFLFSSQGQRALFDQNKRHPADQWTWVAMTYKDGMLRSYVDGVQELEGAVNFPPMKLGRISLGVRQNQISWFKGEIGEVRFRPTALSAGELQRAGH